MYEASTLARRRVKTDVGDFGVKLERRRFTSMHAILLTRHEGNMKAFLRSCLTVALVIAMATAVAQSYPVKPIRLVVPYASGESMDVTARMVAEKWSTALGQQLAVDNRPGASALLGSEYVAKAAPDGYTLLYANVGPLAISPSLYTKMPYDVTKDFAPLAQVANLPFVLYVSPTLPVSSLKEF